MGRLEKNIGKFVEPTLGSEGIDPIHRDRLGDSMEAAQGFFRVLVPPAIQIEGSVEKPGQPQMIDSATRRRII